jgi:hypothetical protein
MIVICIIESLNHYLSVASLRIFWDGSSWRPVLLLICNISSSTLAKRGSSSSCDRGDSVATNDLLTTAAATSEDKLSALTSLCKARMVRKPSTAAPKRSSANPLTCTVSCHSWGILSSEFVRASALLKVEPHRKLESSVYTLSLAEAS